MSATNRGEERYDYDHYPTPAWCVHRLLEKVRLPSGLWIDPCAGAGDLIRAAYTDAKSWHANDIQEMNRGPLVRLASAVEISDITKWPEHNGHPFYDVWITNPPYNLAREVIEVGMQHAINVVMLLRINFFGSKERQPWLSQNMPWMVAVLPDRPAFRLSKKTGKLGTDATEYAWFVWKSWDDDGPLSFKRKETSLVMCDLTDPKVLKADRERIRAGSQDNRSHSARPPQDSPVEPEAI